MIYYKKEKLWTKIIKNYIQGKIQSRSENYQSVFDPSKGEVIGKVVLSNEDDFNQVIQSSVKSQREWSLVTPLKRSRILAK